MSAQNSPKLLCIKDRLTENNTLVPFAVKQPNGFKKTYYLSKSFNIILELIKFKEQYRSWFLGDYVLQDGSLYMMTKVDPIFVLLHFLVNVKDRFLDVLQVVNENQLLYLALTSNEVDLSVVADNKVIDGNIYIKYNKQETEKFLAYKVESLAKYLKTSSIASSDKEYKVAGFQSGRKIEQTEDDCRRCAIDLISAYLPPSLATELKIVYKSLFDEKSSGLFKKIDMKRKLPDGDKKSGNCPTYMQDQMSKKQKTLTKTPKKIGPVKTSGTRSITDFFKKKN